MKKTILFLMSILLGASVSGCNLALLRAGSPTPTSLILPSISPVIASPTISIPSPTPLILLPSPTETAPLPSPTPTLPLPSPTATSTTQAGNTAAITPGSPSGPYAVILVSPGDVLNIRSRPGAGNPVVGTFAPTATNVMRNGPAAMVGDDLWVEVQNPGGGAGWVNARFLTEYMAPTAFCADARIPTLLAALGNALIARNGVQLASLASPAHGMAVNLWRYGRTVTFYPKDARWVFDSTYEHQWGDEPGSGLPTVGSFQAAVLPKLQEVFRASYTLSCNDPGVAATFSLQPWPAEYANFNFYGVYKPGTPGIEMDWRLWLVGVEYVQGSPYVAALIHFQWEP